MRKQRGVTLTGLMVTSVVLIFILLLGFKLFRPYTEYYAIQKIFKTLAVKPEVRHGTRRAFLSAWASYSQIEAITSINGEDVEITKDGTDIVLSASYQVKVPLVKNISLLINFNPTSGP